MDGKFKILAVDPANPAAPTQKELDEGIDLTDYAVASDYSWHADEDTTGVELSTLTPVPYATVTTDVEKMAAAMKELGKVTDEQFLRAWAKLAESYTATPQDELKFRLNASLAGEDPGQPMNTGPDGWRI